MVRKLPSPADGDATRSKRIPSDAASTCAWADSAVAVVGHALPFAFPNAAANFCWAFVTAPKRWSDAPLLVGSFRKPLSASRRAWHSSAAAFRTLDPHLAWSFDPRSRPALTVLATAVNAPVADDTNDAEQSTPSCFAFASIVAKAAASFLPLFARAPSRLDAS